MNEERDRNARERREARMILLWFWLIDDGERAARCRGVARAGLGKGGAGLLVYLVCGLLCRNLSD